MILLASASLAPPSAAGQSSAPLRVSLAWDSGPPVQGTLAWVLVRLDTSASEVEVPSRVGGTLAGEPLHFRAESGGVYRALAGVPVDAGDSIRATVTLERADGAVDSLIRELPVARGEYRHERLTVASRFGTRPDSALAARIAREFAEAREVSRRAHETPSLWQDAFMLPRDSRITSGFGHGREFNGAVQSRHMGTDLAGSEGAPVHAANRGIVALVGDFYYAGNAVYVDHGGGIVTAYFHLSEVAVARGDTVRRGQLLGRVGATGRVTGPHLHWVLRYGSVSLDPLSALRLTRAEEALTHVESADEKLQPQRQVEEKTDPPVEVEEKPQPPPSKVEDKPELDDKPELPPRKVEKPERAPPTVEKPELPPRTVEEKLQSAAPKAEEQPQTPLREIEATPEQPPSELEKETEPPSQEIEKRAEQSSLEIEKKSGPPRRR